MDDRIEREKAFHNARFADTPERTTIGGSCMTALTRLALAATYNRLSDLAPGRTVLDYGCGQGVLSWVLAKNGAERIFGIDISEEAIEQAKSKMVHHGVDIASFQVMNAEQLEFADSSFDLVCGVGILHHLSLDTALSELARVLKPNGTCLFLEPLGHNPIVNWYRNRTPHLRTEDEHPLLMNDITLIRTWFDRTETEFVNLATLATLPTSFIPGSKKLLKCADTLDRAMFRVLPFLRRYAWNVVLQFSCPRKPGDVVDSSDKNANRAEMDKPTLPVA